MTTPTIAFTNFNQITTLYSSSHLIVRTETYVNYTKSYLSDVRESEETLETQMDLKSADTKQSNNVQSCQSSLH